MLGSRHSSPPSVAQHCWRVTPTNFSERGLVNEDGELRARVDVVQRLFTTQLKIARELGLTPAALGKLRNEKPIDLAAAFANDDKAE